MRTKGQVMDTNTSLMNFFETKYRVMKRTPSKRTSIHNYELFHCLRKTCASHLAAIVGPEAACNQLGHSDQQVTKRYIDKAIARTADASVVLPRPDLEGGDLAL